MKAIGPSSSMQLGNEHKFECRTIGTCNLGDTNRSSPDASPHKKFHFTMMDWWIWITHVDIYMLMKWRKNADDVVRAAGHGEMSLKITQFLLWLINVHFTRISREQTFSYAISVLICSHFIDAVIAPTMSIELMAVPVKASDRHHRQFVNGWKIVCDCKVGTSNHRPDAEIFRLLCTYTLHLHQHLAYYFGLFW